MNFYLAPLEGITGYILRNAIYEQFGTGIDKYFTPFIEPHTHKKNLKSRELNDILPAHNEGLFLVPQVMTNSAEAFLFLEEELLPFGYRELNINLGCPSPTVTAKGRGSGLLQYPDQLDEMLYGIFEKTQCEISVKTRIGFSDPEEWPAILEIYNKYPLKELIIHTRVRNEFYQGRPHEDAFLYALKHSQHKLCYNGDICDVKGYLALLASCQAEAGRLPDAVMAGRGMMTDPSLLSRLASLDKAGLEKAAADPDAFQSHLSKDEILRFADTLMAGYCEVLSGETPVLHKMKEFWTWLIQNFPDHEKHLKKILKAKSFKEYRAAIENLLHNC